MSTQQYEIRGQPRRDQAVLVAFWLLAFPIFAAKLLRSMAGRLLVASQVGLGLRWWLLSRASSMEYGEVAEREINQFSESVVMFLLSLPEWLTVGSVTAMMFGFAWWQLSRHWDQMRRVWYATNWTQKLALGGAVALYLYLRYEVGVVPAPSPQEPGLGLGVSR